MFTAYYKALEAPKVREGVDGLGLGWVESGLVGVGDLKAVTIS